MLLEEPLRFFIELPALLSIDLLMEEFLADKFQAKMINNYKST